MNIDDAQPRNVSFATNELYWRDIFDGQKALIEKYEPIEKANGIVIPDTYDLNDRRTQQRLKDFFWRATEEVCEALEKPVSLYQWRTRWKNDDGVRHIFEELADVLHFMVEATIISGLPPLGDGLIPLSVWVDWLWDGCNAELFSDVEHTPAWLEFEVSCYRIVGNLGLAANCLKNKPWKQTHMETDKDQYFSHFARAWQALLSVLKSLHLDVKDIHNLYFQKNHVNQFRQASKY